MTGSLQEKNGMFYMVLNFKDEEGKRKQKWVKTGLSIKGNKRRAEQMLSEFIAESSGSTYIKPSKTLFCDFIADWIEIHKSDIQATTYDGYKYVLKNHIYPYFKNSGLTVQQITPMHIAKYHKDKLSEELSPNTVIRHHAIIRAALQFAVKKKLIKENAADMVDKPSHKKFYAKFYNENEINILFSVIKGTSIEVPVFLACYFGLRRSEVIGIKWDAVDLINKTITICHKVVKARVDGKFTFYCSDNLKTASSYRTLPLDEKVCDYFKELLDRKIENRNIYGNSYVTRYENYVCVNDKGELLRPDYVSSVFGQIIEKNNLKHIRFHDLRHSCASLLLNMGYSMKDIQEWLGHSNFLTTADIYAHVDPRNKRIMIDEIGSKLKL